MFITCYQPKTKTILQVVYCLSNKADENGGIENFIYHVMYDIGKSSPLLLSGDNYVQMKAEV